MQIACVSAWIALILLRPRAHKCKVGRRMILMDFAKDPDDEFHILPGDEPPEKHNQRPDWKSEALLQIPFLPAGPARTETFGIHPVRDLDDDVGREPLGQIFLPDLFARGDV